MGILGRLLRREATAALVLWNRRAVLCFRYNQGLVPYERVLAHWPELAPLAPLVPRPGLLTTPVPRDRLPEAIAAMDTLAESCAGTAKLNILVADELRLPPEPAPKARSKRAPTPEPAPSRPAGEAFFRDARALLDRAGEDAEPVPLEAAYPTYDILSPEQLRWYLCLRDRLRRGEAPDTPYPYLLLLEYELVNGLGVENPRRGLDMLTFLWRSYRGRCPALAGAPARWIWDYAQVYGVDRSPGELLAALPGLPDLVADALLTALEDAGAPLELPVWLLSRLSGYDLEASRFFQKAEDPDALGALYTGAVAAVDAALRQATGKGILDGRCMARLRAQEVTAFRGAPVLSERTYTLRVRRFHGSPRLAAWLSPLLRYIENRLRARYRFSGRLKGAEPDATSRAAVDAFLAQLPPPGREKPAAPAPRLTLDMGSVARLRAESDAVREALLAAVAADAPGEEPDGPIPWEDPVPPSQAEPEPAGGASAAPPDPGDPWAAFLARADRDALAALLDGPDALRTLARRQNRMPAALLDELNEAAADTLGDLIADADGVYEEYADPLRRMLED